MEDIKGFVGGGDGLWGIDEVVDGRDGGGEGRCEDGLVEDEVEATLGCDGGGEGLCCPEVTEEETDE